MSKDKKGELADRVTALEGARATPTADLLATRGVPGGMAASWIRCPHGDLVGVGQTYGGKVAACGACRQAGRPYMFRLPEALWPAPPGVSEAERQADMLLAQAGIVPPTRPPAAPEADLSGLPEESWELVDENTALGKKPPPESPGLLGPVLGPDDPAPIPGGVFK